MRMTVIKLLNRLKTLASNNLLSAHDPYWSELMAQRPAPRSVAEQQGKRSATKGLVCERDDCVPFDGAACLKCISSLRFLTKHGQDDAWADHSVELKSLVFP
jgi:hypothetical protein